MTTILRCSIALTILSALAFATPARAQEVTRMPDAAKQSVGLETGLENAFIARATYAHRVDLGFTPDARLFGRFTLPFVNPDLGDWGVDFGVRASASVWGDLRFSLGVAPLLRRSVNEVFSATAAGIGATALLGYESASWGLSAELGYEQVLATHLSHSARYRDTTYADAKDGWYSITGSTARAGLRGGVRFGSVEIGARAGIETTGRFHALTPPFYFTLGSAYSF